MNKFVKSVNMGPKWSFEHKKPDLFQGLKSPDKNESIRVKNAKKMRTLRTYRYYSTVRCKKAKRDIASKS